MRLVTYNHSHPLARHVSSIRLWEFARALARRGHRVVHVTSTLDGARESPPPEHLERAMKAHDWKDPFHVAVKARNYRLLDSIRANAVAPPIRKTLTAYAMLVRGGMFYDWTDAIAPYQREIARLHQPDVAWGTFGNSSNLLAARRMASIASCSLVIDVKDSVEAFLPPGTRRITARRNHVANGSTTNSELLVRKSAFLTGHAPHLVYSGVDDAFIETPGEAAPANGPFLISLSGSVRSRTRLAEFLEACRAFRERHRGIRDVQLAYAGNETHEIQRLQPRIDLEGWVTCLGYLDRPRLAAKFHESHINAYISAEGAGYHQKFLELVSAGRPVIAYGGELAESLNQARDLPCRVSDPKNPAELDAELEAIMHMAPGAKANGAFAKLGWEARAVGAEQALLDAIARTAA
ncbi:MAG TPA: glycosyltransferase [Usitatibacter sp.]|jgi:hypothetical protein